MKNLTVTKSELTKFAQENSHYTTLDRLDTDHIQLPTVTMDSVQMVKEVKARFRKLSAENKKRFKKGMKYFEANVYNAEFVAQMYTDYMAKFDAIESAQ